MRVKFVTVGELIDELLEYDRNMPVVLPSDDHSFHPCVFHNVEYAVIEATGNVSEALENEIGAFKVLVIAP